MVLALWTLMLWLWMVLLPAFGSAAPERGLAIPVSQVRVSIRPQAALTANGAEGAGSHVPEAVQRVHAAMRADASRSAEPGDGYCPSSALRPAAPEAQIGKPHPPDLYPLKLRAFPSSPRDPPSRA